MNKALIVLIVGMITVFVILFLVVISGQLLIRITNRFYPQPIAKATNKQTKPAPSVSHPTPSSLDKRKIAAIVAAVNLATAGRGRVEKIEKIHNTS